MPIYEYECSRCGHTLETIQKVSDPVLTNCPACHTTNLHKKISKSAFRLKGSGWYVTDFKGDNKAGESATKPPDSGSNADEKSVTKDSGKQTAGSETKAESGKTESPTASSE